ncbi:MAG: GNAT family N-acetyltransferase [Acidimicrobiia bacterium]|nr:GNAT family N-acetyltransferase [Acidimicrobiia bacterium]
MTPAEIAGDVERLAYRSWPAQEEEQLVGWVLRSSPGLRTRRINSATSPIGPGMDASEAEQRIRRWYEERESDPIVRILSVSDPGIDAHFASAGWESEAPTLVMTAVLDQRRTEPMSRLASTIDSAWADAKQRLTGMSDTVTATWLRRASDIRGATAYASVVHNGTVIAIGQGVVEDGWLGLFDLNTDPAYRRQGIADGIVADLEQWAGDLGVSHAYLQVEEQNHAARQLYAKRGYDNVYSYWYRRRA